MSTKAFKFGIARSMMADCLSTDDMELIESQIRLGHEYDNARREIEFDRREKYRQARREVSPKYDALQKQIEALGDQITACFAEIKEERKKQRTQTPSGIEPIQAEIKRLKSERDFLIKQCIEVVKDLKSNAELIEISDQINEQAKLEQKAKRAEFISKGLYWGTSGQIDVSVKLNKVDRFARFDGSGCVCVQIQSQKDKPQRYTSELAKEDGLFWVGKLLATRGKEQRKQGYTEVRECFLRVTGKELGTRIVRLPVIFHRPVPYGVVKRVILQKSKKANQAKYHLLISVDTISEPQETNDRWCAVRTGWAMKPEGVQVVTGKGCDGVAIEKFLDLQHLKDLEKIDAVKKQRSDRFNEILPQLDRYLKDRKEYLPDWVNEFCQYRFNWKSMKKVAILRGLLFKSNGPEEQRLIDFISPWISQDKKRWQHEVNLHRRLQNRRNDWYRKLVKQLRDRYSIVFVSDKEVSELTKKDSKVEDNEWHNTKANRQASSAAPSTFITYLEQSFPNRVVKVDSKNIALICSKCGHKNKKTDSQSIKCGGCGRTYEVGKNAIAHIISRGKQMVADGELERLEAVAKAKSEKQQSKRLNMQEGLRKASKKKSKPE